MSAHPRQSAPTRDVSSVPCAACGDPVRKDRCVVDGRDKLHDGCYDKRYGLGDER